MQNQLVGSLALMAVCLGGSLYGGFIDKVFSSSKTAEAQNPSIRVLIAHDVQGAMLEVNGRYKLFDPNKNGFIATRFIGKRKYIQTQAEGLKWGEEFPGLYQIVIVPDDHKTTTVVDGIDYSGKVYVYDIGGTISIVNEVPLEDYVKTILSAKYDRRLPDEMAAAVAIMARSQAYYALQNAPAKYFDVDAKKVDYQGNTAAEDKRFYRAVQDTRNMVLIRDGRPFFPEWAHLKAEEKGIASEISFSDADRLAGQGDHAAQILLKAYPESSLTLIK